MPLDNLDHIGIAVLEIEESIRVFEELLGIPCSDREEIPSQGLKLAFFHLNNIKLELISSTNPDTPIDRFIKKKGQGIHHLAFQVDDIEKEMDSLLDQGFQKIGISPQMGAHHKLVQFLYPKETNNVLVELCQQVFDQKND